MPHALIDPNTTANRSAADARSAPETRPRELAQVIGSCLLFFWLINLALALLLEHTGQNQGYQLVREKWRQLNTLERPVDYLILGDSSCNQGIDPQLLGSALQARAHNFCTIGGMLLVEDAWMLQLYLERFQHVRVVLLAHVYDIWDRSDSELERALWNLDRVHVDWQRFQPALALSRRRQLEHWLAPWLPSYSQNQSLIRLLTEPERLFRAPRSIDQLGFQSEVEAHPERVASDTVRHLRQLVDTPFRISEPNLRALHTIGELARKHRIRVLYVPAPVSAELASNPAYQLRRQAIVAALRLFADSYPGLDVLAAEPPRFDAHVMQNADHLTAGAAKTYTAWLAAELARRTPAAP